MVLCRNVSCVDYICQAALAGQVELQWVEAGGLGAGYTRATLERWLWLVWTRDLGFTGAGFSGQLEHLDHVTTLAIKMERELTHTKIHSSAPPTPERVLVALCPFG